MPNPRAVHLPSKPGDKAYRWFVEAFGADQAAARYAKHFSKAEYEKLFPPPKKAPKPEKPKAKA